MLLSIDDAGLPNGALEDLRRPECVRVFTAA